MTDARIIDIHLDLKDLDSKLRRLRSVGAASAGATWAPPGESRDRHQLLQTITNIYNRDDWEPNTTGLIHLNNDALALIDDIREAKKKFEGTVGSFRDACGLKKPSLNDLLVRESERARDPVVAEALQAIKSSRINLLWAYRAIRVLPPRLIRISWSWAHQRSVSTKQGEKPITAGLVLDGIDDLPLPDSAKIAIKGRLSALAPEERLAKVKRVKPHLRANISYLDEAGNTVREAFLTPTVLVLAGEKLPDITWPGAQDEQPAADKQRKQRSDKCIEDEPFIQALGLHRYNPPRLT